MIKCKLTSKGTMSYSLNKNLTRRWWNLGHQVYSCYLSITTISFLEAHIYSMNVILTSYNNKNNQLRTWKSDYKRFTKCINWLTSAPHLPIEWWETGRGCITQVQATCCQEKSPSPRWAGEVTCFLTALRLECEFWFHRRKYSYIKHSQKLTTWPAAPKFSIKYIGCDWLTYTK